MVFIETPIFTKKITEFITDESYKDLQQILLFNPEEGKIIKNANGIRKIRWKLPKQGKRGSLRIIYYYKVISDRIYMLYVYSKKEQKDLTAKQKKILGNTINGL